MKKILLVVAVLVGAISASQAGVNLNIGIGLPVPRASVVISHPVPVYASACPAPVVVRQPDCEPVVYGRDRHRYTYQWHHGRPEWQRRNADGNKFHAAPAPQYRAYESRDRDYDHDRGYDYDRGHDYDGRRY